MRSTQRDDDDDDDDDDDERHVEPELPQYWRDLERRVVLRKPRAGGPTGRGERRKNEADYWLEAGLYDFEEMKQSKSRKKGDGDSGKG